MHDLEQLIADWRNTVKASHKLTGDKLDELESHLREAVDDLVVSGMTPPAAFKSAVAQLGETPAIAWEFRKLDHALWLPVKVIAGVGVMAVLILAGVLARGNNFGWSPLLATHAFFIILGYFSVFLTGALGICFVCQRAFADFSPSRLRSIRRAYLILGSVALGLTTVGVALGAVWAKAEWGRYWAWDIKETGGFCVIVWLAGFLIALRIADRDPRVLAMSLLGNIVVGLAWFGPAAFAALNGSVGMNSWLFLLALAGAAANLLLFAIGLAPSRWLRPQKIR